MNKTLSDQRTPTEVVYIENHWAMLPPHVREAIMTLIDGALSSGLAGETGIRALDVPQAVRNDVPKSRKPT